MLPVFGVVVPRRESGLLAASQLPIDQRVLLVGVEAMINGSDGLLVVHVLDLDDLRLLVEKVDNSSVIDRFLIILLHEIPVGLVGGASAGPVAPSSVHRAFLALIADAPSLMVFEVLVHLRRVERDLWVALGWSGISVVVTDVFYLVVSVCGRFEQIFVSGHILRVWVV